MPHARPRRRDGRPGVTCARCRLPRAILAVTVAVATCMVTVPLAAPADAQVAPTTTTTTSAVPAGGDSTTSSSSTSTTSTTSPPATSTPPTTHDPVIGPPVDIPTQPDGPMASTTTTTGPSTTTSTTIPPGAGVVPPPPPPPPTPAGATPAQLAQAARLEREIASQSVVLDQRADAYNKAHADAQTAAQRLADAKVAQAAATAEVSGAQDDLTIADKLLRQTALEAYLGVKVYPNVSTATPATQAYQLGIASVYSGAAFERASERVKVLHAAQRALKAIEDRVAATTAEAQAQADAAAKADTTAKAAADAAAAQQVKLLAVLGQVKGDLGVLVDVQRATAAVTAYTTLSQGGSLLFTPSGPLPAPLPQTAAVIKVATDQIGKQYVWGATGPDTFDCSGLVQYAWAQLGIHTPRVAADQQAWAVPIPISEVQPGDLVFFGKPAHHVGIYVGNGLMVEAPHTGAVVDVTSVWWSDLAGFGRVHQ